MTPNPQKTDWSKIENVFELLERDGRVLTDGEKQLIAGQRKINGVFFDVLTTLLATFPNESATPAITLAKNLLQPVPGDEPPGCERSIPPVGS